MIFFYYYYYFLTTCDRKQKCHVLWEEGELSSFCFLYFYTWNARRNGYIKVKTLMQRKLADCEIDQQEKWFCQANTLRFGSVSPVLHLDAHSVCISLLVPSEKVLLLMWDYIFLLLISWSQMAKCKIDINVTVMLFCDFIFLCVCWFVLFLTDI